MNRLKLPLNDILKKSAHSLIYLLKEKVSLILLVLLLLDCLGALLIVYLYIIKTPELPPASQNVEINKSLYQEVANRLNAREINIQEGIEKSYPDIFK